MCEVKEVRVGLRNHLSSTRGGESISALPADKYWVSGLTHSKASRCRALPDNDVMHPVRQMVFVP